VNTLSKWITKPFAFCRGGRTGIPNRRQAALERVLYSLFFLMLLFYILIFYINLYKIGYGSEEINDFPKKVGILEFWLAGTLCC